MFVISYSIKSEAQFVSAPNHEPTSPIAPTPKSIAPSITETKPVVTFLIPSLINPPIFSKIFLSSFVVVCGSTWVVSEMIPSLSISTPWFETAYFLLFALLMASNAVAKVLVL